MTIVKQIILSKNNLYVKIKMIIFAISNKN